MVPCDRNTLILRAGLSLAAALMLSGAAVAGQASGARGPDVATAFGDGWVLVDEVVVQTTHEINPDASGGDEGIAVGEPDPTGGSGDDPATGDGSDGSGDQATGDGSGDGTDVSGDGSDDGTDVTGDGSGDVTDSGDGIDVIYTMDGGSNCGGCEYQNAVPVFQMQSGGIAHNAPAQIVVHSDHEVARQTVAHGSAACTARHPGLPWMCEWQSGASQ